MCKRSERFNRQVAFRRLTKCGEGFSIYLVYWESERLRRVPGGCLKRVFIFPGSCFSTRRKTRHETSRAPADRVWFPVCVVVSERETLGWKTAQSRKANLQVWHLISLTTNPRLVSPVPPLQVANYQFFIRGERERERERRIIASFKVPRVVVSPKQSARFQFQ